MFFLNYFLNFFFFFKMSQNQKPKVEVELYKGKSDERGHADMLLEIDSEHQKKISIPYCSKVKEIFNKQFHSENMNEIQNLLLTFTNADILFAYGNLISKRLYLKNCLIDIMNLIKNSNFNGSLFCIKKTIKGNPIHPLYQKSDVNFMQY